MQCSVNKSSVEWGLVLYRTENENKKKAKQSVSKPKFSDTYPSHTHTYPIFWFSSLFFIFSLYHCQSPRYEVTPRREKEKQNQTHPYK